MCFLFCVSPAGPSGARPPNEVDKKQTYMKLKHANSTGTCILQNGFTA